ncbi:MAG: DEAD/DEAH box helicase, partial [Cellulosimicrobium funkei]
MTDTPLTVDGAYASLRETFLRFYNTAYNLRDQAISAEREALLRRDGVALTTPYVELIPSYEPSTETLAEVFDAVEVPMATDLIGSGLLPHAHPYKHQAEALVASLSGRDVVVGTGTGSGKTESFLLPVIARLVKESTSWSERSRTDSTWWAAKGPFQPQRENRSGRPAAVRSLVLYPMNALVEDQLVRLRQALDSDAAQEWYARETHGEPFFFGRYTGRTPVAGTRVAAKPERVDRLREILRQADARHTSLLERLSRGEVEKDARYFLPSLTGGEMRSRWDMQETPPDILITNYSMLSIALGRDDEASIFEKTRQWIEASPDNVFTLVVDELHMYRGTAGTEVALLLRRLFRRLGLDTRPKQLSVIATSASIGDDIPGRAFLSEFFARPRDSFAFIKEPERTHSKTDLDEFAATLLADTWSTAAGPTGKTVRQAIESAMTVDGESRPRAVDVLAQKLFPSVGADSAALAFDRIIQRLGAEKNPAARLRAHLMFRTIQGLWACSDPDCTAVAAEYRSAERRIGKIYAAPRFTCECGSRVLELLYCESCGESMLGGFAVKEGKKEYLLASATDLESLPDRPKNERNAANYRVYWPTDRKSVAGDWSRLGKQLDSDPARPKFKMDFTQVNLSPGTGKISALGTKTGLRFRVTTDGVADAVDRMPGFPTRCPSCGDDRELDWLKHLGPESRERSRSPIRTQGVGFDRANQVLTGAIRRLLDSSLVVFSDSRQGAARVAANLQLAHYLDLVRALVLDELTGGSQRLELIEAAIAKKDNSPAATSALADLQGRDPQGVTALMKRTYGVLLDAGDVAAIERVELHLGGTPTLVDLAGAIEPRLLGLGVNPAGPDALLQSTGAPGADGGQPWTDCFRWNVTPPRADEAALDAPAKMLLGGIREELSRQIVRTAFAGGDRDVESLGLAYAVPAEPITLAALPEGVADEFVSSFLRLMLRRRRVTSVITDAKTNWPGDVREYAKKVARRHGA